MYGIELGFSGIYGIKDTLKDKIVYVGSTKTPFAFRWGKHIYDVQMGIHCNKPLSDLITSGYFEFIILDSNKYNGEDILNKEREYSEKYKVGVDGYGINIGGCGHTTTDAYSNALYDTSPNTEIICKYLADGWLNKRITLEYREEIIKYINKYIPIKHRTFSSVIKKLGFKVSRLKTKHDWIIGI